MDVELLNLNPEGWIPGVSNEKNWGMLYGLDVCGEKNLVLTGDTQGYLHFVDPRVGQRLSRHLVHKKSKVWLEIVDWRPSSGSATALANPKQVVELCATVICRVVCLKVLPHVPAQGIILIEYSWHCPLSKCQVFCIVSCGKGAV